MANSDRKRRRLRRMKLYALLTESECRRPWLETAEMLLDGGVDVVQLREKDLQDRELLDRAKALRELTERFGALLIINDRPDVALMCGADGVHLGQDDAPPELVRESFGEDLLIGLSTHDADQVLEAAHRRVDYIGVGPVFPTETKGYASGKGVALIAELCRAAAVPTVAIGGIDLENAEAVIRAGPTAVAVCRALCASPDPKAAAQQFLRISESCRATEEGI